MWKSIVFFFYIRDLAFWNLRINNWLYQSMSETAAIYNPILQWQSSQTVRHRHRAINGAWHITIHVDPEPIIRLISTLHLRIIQETHTHTQLKFMSLNTHKRHTYTLFKSDFLFSITDPKGSLSLVFSCSFSSLNRCMTENNPWRHLIKPVSGRGRFEKCLI